MDRRRSMAAWAASIAVVPLTLVVLPDAEAYGHGWVTSPPSRQELCARRRVPNCGGLEYEPQSVEAPKGARSCSGGGRFPVVDDEGRNWPVASVGGTVNITWQKTAPHSTLNWQYYVDGRLVKTVPGNNVQPGFSVTHQLTGLPGGRHKILAVWNIGDTVMAFYSCIDVQVGGGGGNPPPPNPNPNPPPPPPPNPNPPPRPTPPAPGACGPAWSASAIYTGGMQVSHRGGVWKAKWWTRGEEPGTTGQWGVWQHIGSCVGGRAQIAFVDEAGLPIDDPNPIELPPGMTTPPTGPIEVGGTEATEGFGCTMARDSGGTGWAWATTAALGLILTLGRRRRRQ